MRGYNHDHNPHGKHSQLSINGQTFPSCPGFCGTGKKGYNLRIILFYFKNYLTIYKKKFDNTSN